MTAAILRRSLAGLLFLTGCDVVSELPVVPLKQLTGEPTEARRNSVIPGDPGSRREFDAPGRPAPPVVALSAPTGSGGAQAGDVTLNFADTDIREIVRTVLGTTLKLNYTIDPAVRGTASFEGATPLNRSQLLATLETLLNQNHATVVEKNGVYQIVPIAVGVATNAIAGASEAMAGTQIVTLRYASAATLAKLLEPYVAEDGKITAEPGRNALIVSGDAVVRKTLVDLIGAFDVDLLAGRSFALFPVGDGNPGQLAAQLEKLFLAEPDAPLAGVVRVLPLDQANMVLVATSQPRYIAEARRFFSLTNRAADATTRVWHVYYVQSGRSADLENLLQRAFTPNRVTGGGSGQEGRTAPGTAALTMNSQGAGTAGGGASGSLLQNRGAAIGTAALATPLAPDNSSAAGQPLSGATQDEEQRGEKGIRIIADHRSNALLIYANPAEYTVMEGMLRKIDIIPQQVMIEATIAEVTLNDALSYGTQFYLKDRLASTLTQGTQAGVANFAANFPGFVLTGGSHVAINALAQVSKVRVLSSPEVMVLDNEAARLLVGEQVPVITGSAQSTLSAGAPIVNNVDYRETGVIMQVTPHVNAGGLVSLDIGQEVSDVAATTSSTIDSPTFNERLIRTRVIVQDGQTVGMAGLIRDNDSRGNSGIPFLKDIPLLGFLASSQNDTRQRTELLVLITPHVVHDQRGARALTRDLRNQLINAQSVPEELNSQPLSGLANPQGRSR
ncbi:MAG TPA: type II secretion system secretin GspD [Stellaceae bacterium]|nr:type II secretion system secretin GspD [Stellaceae bacterium]